jgi:hypothetical protein
MGLEMGCNPKAVWSSIAAVCSRDTRTFNVGAMAVTAYALFCPLAVNKKQVVCITFIVWSIIVDRQYLPPASNDRKEEIAQILRRNTVSSVAMSHRVENESSNSVGVFVEKKCFMTSWATHTVCSAPVFLGFTSTTSSEKEACLDSKVNISVICSSSKPSSAGIPVAGAVRLSKQSKSNVI